jgi:hypothetical protein
MHRRRALIIALKILTSIVLLAVTLWLFNLAAYNTWAAFLSHQKYPANGAIYASRSNMFFAWTCITGVTFLIFTGWNLRMFIRHRRKQNGG